MKWFNLSSWMSTWTALDRAQDTFITLKEKSFGYKNFWTRCTRTKVQKWLFGKKIAFFGSISVSDPLQSPGPPMYLFARINWIISCFHHRILKILFVLGSSNTFRSLGCRIGKCFFLLCFNFISRQSDLKFYVSFIHLDSLIY